MLEQSVLICRDTGRMDQISGLAERGGLLYRQHGSPESAAQLLEKAAKILESKDPQGALQLYEKAAETIMVEDRPKQAAEYLTKVSRLQVKAKLWDKASDTLENAVRMLQEAGSTGTVGRLVCGMVLVELARDDTVAAAKQFAAWGGYCDGDQTAAIKTILSGFDDEDGEVARQGLSMNAIKGLDVEFTILARDIKVPESGAAGGLEAAAAAMGAQRAAAAAATSQPPARVSAPAAPAEASSVAEHSFGVDPVSAADLGETKEQREEDARQQQRLNEEEDEDEDDLC